MRFIVLPKSIWPIRWQRCAWPDYFHVRAILQILANSNSNLNLYNSLIAHMFIVMFWPSSSIQCQHGKGLNEAKTWHLILWNFNLNFEFTKLWTIAQVWKQSSHPHCCLTKPLLATDHDCSGSQFSHLSFFHYNNQTAIISVCEVL